MSREVVPFVENSEMWTLAPDRQTVRLTVPVEVAPLREPIRVLVDFDAEGVDDALKRLIVLRARMADLQMPQADIAPSNRHDKDADGERRDQTIM